MRCLTHWRLNTPGQTFTDDARLIVSELVTNAVLHALKPLQRSPRQRLWLALHMQPNALICAVSDPSPAPPRMPAPAPWADAGRGLQLVTALSTAWGWTPTPPPARPSGPASPSPATDTQAGAAPPLRGHPSPGRVRIGPQPAPNR